MPHCRLRPRRAGLGRAHTPWSAARCRFGSGRLHLRAATRIASEVTAARILQSMWKAIVARPATAPRRLESRSCRCSQPVMRCPAMATGWCRVRWTNDTAEHRFAGSGASVAWVRRRGTAPEKSRPSRILRASSQPDRRSGSSQGSGDTAARLCRGPRGRRECSVRCRAEGQGSRSGARLRHGGTGSARSSP